MPTYLRFTPAEYRALVPACRSLDLSDSSYLRFRVSLVQSLLAQNPGLAIRVARFSKSQLDILYEGLKERRQAGYTRPES